MVSTARIIERSLAYYEVPTVPHIGCWTNRGEGQLEDTSLYWEIQGELALELPHWD